MLLQWHIDSPWPERTSLCVFEVSAASLDLFTSVIIIIIIIISNYVHLTTVFWVGAGSGSFRAFAQLLSLSNKACWLPPPKASGDLVVVVVSGTDTVFSSPEEPDPPTDLELTDQRERSVQLTWIPGDEHNSPTQSTVL
jgi:hypothetical protein